MSSAKPSKTRWGQARHEVATHLQEIKKTVAETPSMAAAYESLKAEGTISVTYGAFLRNFNNLTAQMPNEGHDEPRSGRASQASPSPSESAKEASEGGRKPTAKPASPIKSFSYDPHGGEADELWG